MPISSQILEKQLATFDDSIKGAFHHSNRRILLMCRENLGMALCMRAARHVKSARPDDTRPIRMIASDALRVRGIEFPIGLKLWHGLRSPKALVNLSNLSYIFLEMPADSQLMLRLMADAKAALHPAGRIVVIDGRLLSEIRQKPLIPKAQAVLIKNEPGYFSH